MKKTRKCVDCKKWKPLLSEFYLRKNPNKTKKIYHNSLCKACCIIRVLAWKKKNIKKFRAYQRKWIKAKRKHESN